MIASIVFALFPAGIPSDICKGIAPTVAATLTNVILRAVQEARHNNLSLFRRLKQLLKDDSRVFVFFANEHHCETFPEELHGESPNDRNDRAIRIATSWSVLFVLVY